MPRDCRRLRDAFFPESKAKKRGGGTSNSHNNNGSSSKQYGSTDGEGDGDSDESDDGTNGSESGGESESGESGKGKRNGGGRGSGSGGFLSELTEESLLHALVVGFVAAVVVKVGIFAARCPYPTAARGGGIGVAASWRDAASCFLYGRPSPSTASSDACSSGSGGGGVMDGDCVDDF